MGIHRRGDQDQLNVVATADMFGPAGRVFVINGKPFISLEDVTQEMIDKGMQIGIATAGIWSFNKKAGVAVAQMGPVNLNLTTQEVDATGQFIGYAERAATASDTTVYVVFASFLKAT